MISQNLDENHLSKIKMLKKDSFGNYLIVSKKKPNLIEGVRAKDIYNTIFRKFLNNISIKHCSGNTYLRAVFAKKIK